MHLCVRLYSVLVYLITQFIIHVVSGLRCELNMLSCAHSTFCNYPWSFWEWVSIEKSVGVTVHPPCHSFFGIFKADSRIACHAHAVPLPCLPAKCLECGFPIWFTQCSQVWITLAVPRPCPAPTMPFFSRPRHRTAVERWPVGDRPAFGFFQLPRGVPQRLLSEAYQSQMQVASVKPNNVCHGQGKEW